MRTRAFCNALRALSQSTLRSKQLPNDMYLCAERNIPALLRRGRAYFDISDRVIM